MGIRPILNIPGFGEVMTAAYLTFLAPDELDALLRFLIRAPGWHGWAWASTAERFGFVRDSSGRPRLSTARIPFRRTRRPSGLSTISRGQW